MFRTLLASLALALIFISGRASASEGVDDIIRMQKAGVSADVMLAFVDTSSVNFTPSADDIQRLEDAAVPATVIVAMLDKGKDNNTTDLTATSAIADNAPIAASDTETVSYAPPAENADVSTFYETLAPYGEWQEKPDLGYVWTPTVATGPDWRPYANNGHWVWTDQGWYWESSYAWGWAPFHYGRWSNVDSHWYWRPDTTWGSAWVDWRHSNEYYGWAPLPIGAVFDPNVGFSYRDRHFGLNAGLDFGLGASAYTFVPVNGFLSADIGTVVVHRDRWEEAYRNTRPLERSYGYSSNRVVNNGIPREEVAQRTGKQIEVMHIQDANVASGKAIPREHRQGNEIVTYRPTLRNTTSVDPKTAIERGREMARTHQTARNVNATPTQNSSVTQSQINARRESAARTRLTETQARERLVQERSKQKMTIPERQNVPNTPEANHAQATRANEVRQSDTERRAAEENTRRTQEATNVNRAELAKQAEVQRETQLKEREAANQRQADIVRQQQEQRRVEQRPAPAERTPAVREPATREPAAREPAVREPAVREPAAREPAVREPAAREPAPRAAAPVERAAAPVERAPAAREPAAREPAPRDAR